jgi:predicted nucleic acid-binding protein
MSGRFFDSNVFLYLSSDDARKSDLAEKALIDGGTISVQVLNEVASAARRKMKRSWTEIETFLAEVEQLVTVLPLTIETHRYARGLCARYAFSFYDGLILASALEAGCGELFTEDLQHGQRIGSVRIVNPFV